MKRILITGMNSYIGNSFKEWLSQWPEKYEVDKVSTRNGIWKETSFEGYDSILHVAGIAHIKETKENRDLYYKVNRDLAVDIAKKAKKEGVKQFIFLSSMSVYGLNTGVIDKHTSLNPKNAYGKSKLEAEQIISEMQDDSFLVAIVRPPMVYGKKTPGNYHVLSKFIKKIRIFPNYSNKRSMIFIDNLTEFFKLIMDLSLDGTFKPQNAEYINSKDMVTQIARFNSIKVWFVPNILNIFNFLNNHVGLFSKVLGDLVYSKEISKLLVDNKIFDYNEIGFEKSIEVTENG